MNTLSQIYISQSEIVSTLQNNQSENAFYVSSVLCRKAWQPACDFFDSASTDILPCLQDPNMKMCTLVGYPSPLSFTHVMPLWT
jgi:hypothetical protein